MKKLTVLSFIVLSSSVLTIKAQNITTVAGNGYYGYTGDGGQATAAELKNPIGVIVDASGNLYISDYAESVVRKVDASGIITTLAGTGVAGYNSDNIQATAAQINGPGGLGVDAAGNIYITELAGYRIRKVDVTSGIITTVAGTGSGGSGGDGGQATNAQVTFVTDVKFDNLGNFYIADEDVQRVRMVNTSGIINTIAGNGFGGFSGDGGAATSAELYYPTGVIIDAAGNVYIGDQLNSRIRMVNTSGVISTYAGNGTAGYYGDGGAATASELNHPEELGMDAAGNLYIDDEGTNTIRMVNTSGVISTFAGNGVGGFYGDGGPATAAELSGQQGVCVDNKGNVFIGDYGNTRVREVNAIPTAINNIRKEGSISVYPNPAKEEMNIALTGLDGEVTLTLFNIQGKEILNQSYTDKKTITVNTAALAAGTYILKIQKAGVAELVRKVEVEK